MKSGWRKSTAKSYDYASINAIATIISKIKTSTVMPETVMPEEVFTNYEYIV